MPSFFFLASFFFSNLISCPSPSCLVCLDELAPPRLVAPQALYLWNAVFTGSVLPFHLSLRSVLPSPTTRLKVPLLVFCYFVLLFFFFFSIVPITLIIFLFYVLVFQISFSLLQERNFWENSLVLFIAVSPVTRTICIVGPCKMCITWMNEGRKSFLTPIFVPPSLSSIYAIQDNLKNTNPTVDNLPWLLSSLE